jgi:hypothetical protein
MGPTCQFGISATHLPLLNCALCFLSPFNVCYPFILLDVTSGNCEWSSCESTGQQLVWHVVPALAFNVAICGLVAAGLSRHAPSWNSVRPPYRESTVHTVLIPGSVVDTHIQRWYRHKASFIITIPVNPYRTPKGFTIQI